MLTKVVESIFEHRIRQQIDIDDMQFGFMKSKGTTDAFLADRTIGRAFGKLCWLSVVCLSVTFCIVAKWYVLAKNCLKERIGNQGQKVDFLGHRHISTSGFASTATETADFALFLPTQLSNRY